MNAREVINDAVATAIQWSDKTYASAVMEALHGAGFVILPKSEVEAIRDKALEDAADLMKPKRPRPCDCEYCVCGKMEDWAEVTRWDADAMNAIAIRKLKSGGE